MVSSIERGVPAKKGENVGSAVIHGVQFREKRLDVRSETWSVWITDNEPISGSVAVTEAGRRSQFNENYDTVFNLLNQMPELLTVEHVRVDPNDSTQYSERIGYAEIVGAITVGEHRELNYSEFSVEVQFPDPRWFSPGLFSASVAYAGSNIALPMLASSVGTAPVTYMTITFVSTSNLTNPKITNETYPNSLSSVGFTGTIPTGQAVILDTDALTLERNGANDISKLYRAGSRQSWFELFPINNDLTFSATSGTGTVSISYRKAFF
jgi:hypothetical protein